MYYLLFVPTYVHFSWFFIYYQNASVKVEARSPTASGSSLSKEQHDQQVAGLLFKLNLLSFCNPKKFAIVSSDVLDRLECWMPWTHNVRLHPFEICIFCLYVMRNIVVNEFFFFLWFCIYFSEEMRVFDCAVIFSFWYTLQRLGTPLFWCF